MSRKEGRKELQHLRRRMRFLAQRIANRKQGGLTEDGDRYDREELPALEEAVAYWEVCFGIDLVALRRLLDASRSYSAAPEPKALAELGSAAQEATAVEVVICEFCGGRNGHRVSCKTSKTAPSTTR